VLHEPLTDNLKSIITTDIKNIVSSDPRLAVDRVMITEYDQGLQIDLELRYVQTNQSSLLNLQFDHQSNQLTAR
jgi:hypothetical protein